MRKVLVFVTVCAMLCCCFTTAAYAAEPSIMPLYNNLNREETDFEISSDGTATVSVYYYGIIGVTKGATVTTKIQKYVSGNWVDVTLPNGSTEWVDSSSSFMLSKTHSTTLTSRGRYKAHVTYVIRGTGGADDVITAEIEKTF